MENPSLVVRGIFVCHLGKKQNNPAASAGAHFPLSFRDDVPKYARQGHCRNLDDKASFPCAAVMESQGEVRRYQQRLSEVG
jgi:hypothetical protein